MRSLISFETGTANRVLHQEFGEGQVTHILNGGTKPTLAVKFLEMKGIKILSQNVLMEKIE